MSSERVSFARRMMEWFTAPDTPLPLAWFRIAVASFCLLHTYIVRQYFLDLYGQYGYVQWAITRANLYPGIPHLGNLAYFLRRFGISADQTVYIVMAIYLVALGGLLAGLFSRWMAALTWLLHFLWIHAGGGLVYGMDIFTHIALPYCIIMPVGDAISLDVYFGRRQYRPSVAAGVTRKMLQLHLCIIYMSSGLEKAAGIQWWNGEAIWRSLMMPVFRQFDFGWIARVPWLPMAAGWSVLVIEIGYGIFIWFRKTRPLWLALTIGMHLGIGLFLGMWMFGLVMIILNLGAFGYEMTVSNGRRFATEYAR